MSGHTIFRWADGTAIAGDAGGRPTWGGLGRPPFAAIVAAILAGLVLAPIVTGGVLLLVLTLAALAADNDYEKEI